MQKKISETKEEMQNNENLLYSNNKEDRTHWNGEVVNINEEVVNVHRQNK